MSNLSSSLPKLGFGLGLRPDHYQHIFDNQPAVDWFEIISENYMDTDGRPVRNLQKIKERYPLVMHGVALSIGTVDPLNSEYLSKLKKLAQWVEPAWISDHLCFTGVAHSNTHDLLPLPYTEEALKHVIERIKMVQDYLGRPIALENPSTYLEFKSSTIPEAEFIAHMAKESGCYLLLDVNNVYVSCFNHRLDPKKYIDTLPIDQVVQIHLAGHENCGTHIIDTHDGPVIDDVWNLYKYVVNKAGRVPNTMIEWDDKIPEFPVVYDELLKARSAAAAPSTHGALVDFSKPTERSDYLNRKNVEEEQLRLQTAIFSKDALSSYPAEWIVSKEDFAPEDQLNVYRNAYRIRLHDAVAEDYPALQYYLGDAAFKKMIDGFIESNNPSHFNLGRYAVKLQAFVEMYMPEDKFASELCELETAMSQLADKKETPVLNADMLLTVTEQDFVQARLALRSAFEVFSFSYPVNMYYQAFKNDENPVAPAPQESWLTVFRDEDIMWRMDLERNEYYMLCLITKSFTIGEALDELSLECEGRMDSLQTSLATWFNRWMRHRLLSDVIIPHSGSLTTPAFLYEMQTA